MRQSKPNRRTLTIGKNIYLYDVSERFVQVWFPNGKKEVVQKSKFPMSEIWGPCECGSYGCDYNPIIHHAVRPSDVRKYILSKDT